MPSDPIVIVSYDPAWPQRFAELRQRLARALAAVTSSIEHVGSTAVPGLAAKPVIDIDVALGSTSDLNTAIAAIDDLGYHHRDDFPIAGLTSFQWPPGEPRHHVYACLATCPEFVRHLRLRDLLRADPRTADDYGWLKQDLARRFGDDRLGYNRAKTAFIEDVLGRDG